MIFLFLTPLLGCLDVICTNGYNRNALFCTKLYKRATSAYSAFSIGNTRSHLIPFTKYSLTSWVTDARQTRIEIIFSLSLLMLACGSHATAQDEAKQLLTKADEFAAKSTGFSQIEDFTLPRIILQLSYGETRIRKYTVNDKTEVFYQVTSGDFTGSVSAADFPDLLGAFEKLKAQEKGDIRPSADLLLKKYTDRDGLELGYTVEGKKVTWFVKTHRFHSRTLYIKDPFSLEESLNQASAKLNELK